MSRRSADGLLGFVRRLARPPSPDSDAALLARFAADRDEAAFAEIVRRHGVLVQAVCRRRLGDSPDADDAAQAVFVALARHAGRTGWRESVAGWLVRAAHLTARKAAGRHRDGPLSEVAMTDPPDRPAEAAELKAALDAELAALPDRFRGVAVLCLCEERTSAEAAAVLGIPVGTVDSRLFAARRKLRERLLRRGIAGAAVASVEATLPRAGRAADGFVDEVMRAVTGAVPVAAGVCELADGVLPMTSTKAKAAAAVLVGLGLLGGTGAGVFLAADTPAGRAEPKPADPPPKPEPRGNFGPPAVPVPDTATAALDRPAKVKAADAIAFQELMALVEKEHGIIVRVDYAAFQRLASDPTLVSELRKVEQKKLTLPRHADRIPLRDVLADAVAQLEVVAAETPSFTRVAVVPRGDQLLLTPAYIPMVRPGDKADGEATLMVPENIVSEQMWGPPVTLRVVDRTLAGVLADLRTQTGANIVLDTRCRDKGTQPVAAEMADVRLLAALRVLADMAELHAVWMDNVFYLTTRENAERIDKRVRTELFGAPLAQAPFVPPGYLSDGYQLYLKGDNKPVTERTFLDGGPKLTDPPAEPKK